MAIRSRSSVRSKSGGHLHRREPVFRPALFPSSFSSRAGVESHSTAVSRGAAHCCHRRIRRAGLPAAKDRPRLHARGHLEIEHPGRRFDFINACMTSVNSHVLADIVPEIIAQKPDVAVLYMGNNEVVGPYGPGTPSHGMGAQPGGRLVAEKPAPHQSAQLIGSGSQPDAAQPNRVWDGFQMSPNSRSPPTVLLSKVSMRPLSAIWIPWSGAFCAKTSASSCARSRSTWPIGSGGFGTAAGEFARPPPDAGRPVASRPRPLGRGSPFP